MGAAENAALGRKSIVRMMESKGASDMKILQYYITLNSEETRQMLRSRICMSG